MFTTGNFGYNNKTPNNKAADATKANLHMKI